MYLFPNNFNKLDFIGLKITQISFSQNSVNLYFDADNWIIIYGSFELKINNVTQSYNELYPITNDLGLLFLLEKSISNTIISDSRKEIKICFQDEIELVLISDIYYESFELHIGQYKGLV